SAESKPALCQLHASLDAGERSAQLVAGNREEFAALPRGLLGGAAGSLSLGELPGQAGTSERFASQARDASEQVFIPWSERRWRVRVRRTGTTDREQADQLTVHQHGGGHGSPQM